MIRQNQIIDVLPECQEAFREATNTLAGHASALGIEWTLWPRNKSGGLVAEFTYANHADMAALEQLDAYRVWRSYGISLGQSTHSASGLVFTNGCFDILHAGHIHLLKEARQQGTRLVVAINSDVSVAALKGRCVHTASDRRAVLEAIRYVDEVAEFTTEEELAEMVKRLHPDVLVKGDEPGRVVPGAEYAKRVHRVVKLAGLSTSEAIRKLTGA